MLGLRASKCFTSAVESSDVLYMTVNVVVSLSCFASVVRVCVVSSNVPAAAAAPATRADVFRKRRREIGVAIASILSATNGSVENILDVAEMCDSMMPASI